jgi:hypothetical protein
LKSCRQKKPLWDNKMKTVRRFGGHRRCRVQTLLVL